MEIYKTVSNSEELARSYWYTILCVRVVCVCVCACALA